MTGRRHRTLHGLTPGPAGGCQHGHVRVVSLVPSITETISAWGVEPIACTRFCERPDLSHVGGTKNPDLDRIIELDPDLVLMDREENRREDFEELTDRGLEVHATAVTDLAEVRPTLEALALRLGLDPALLPVSTAPPGPVDGDSPGHHRGSSVFVPIWRRPWMGLGTPTYGSSLLDHLGFSNVLGGEGAYPETSLDIVAELHPDLVLAPSEPYPFSPRHLPELSRVAPTLLVDGKDLFWWGARTPLALGRLAARLASGVGPVPGGR